MMRSAALTLAATLALGATAQAAPAGWKHFTDGAMGYTIAYPPHWTIDTHYETDVLGPGHEIKGVSFTIPDSFQPGTNLSHNDTRLSVESLPGRACKPSQFVDPAEHIHGLKADGRRYLAATSEDAGAGNFYETDVFLVDGASPCIAVRYFVHSTNIGAYDPGTIKAFDEKKLIAVFDAIRATLKLGK